MTPKTLSEKEVGDFLIAVKSKRDLLLVILMLDAGLRVGELVQLQKNDLWQADEPAHTIYIRPEIAEKGGSRFIPTTYRIKEAIKVLDWNGFFSGTLQPEAFVFQGREISCHMTTRQVQRVVKAIGKKSIGRPVNPHMLRHTFATRLMRITNIRVVQELLGHKKLTSTQIYTHPNSDDLTSAIDSLK